MYYRSDGVISLCILLLLPRHIPVQFSAQVHYNTGDNVMTLSVMSYRYIIIQVIM